MRADAKRILPLTGVRVLDLTNVIAGPVATRVLGHLGAEIIKIELPWGRSVGNMAIFTSDKSQERSYNKNAGFNEVNRAKRSISLDLADPRGKALFKDLVSISDVVIENYSPRVMPNLGLTYGHLRTLRPDLIMVAMPALGRPGPLEQSHILRSRHRGAGRHVPRHRLPGRPAQQARQFLQRPDVRLPRRHRHHGRNLEETPHGTGKAD